MRTYTITVREKTLETQRLSAHQDQNLLRVLEESGLVITSPCGGRGVCGKCKVQIVEGPYTKAACNLTERSFFEEWEIKAGYRLACQVKVEEDLTINLSTVDTGSARIMVDGEKKVPLDPFIKEKTVLIPKPSVEDQLSDVERVEEALGIPGGIAPELFSELPALLRAGDFTLSAVLAGDEALSLYSGQATPREDRGIYGIAVDIGTTTMVGYLIDLTTGQERDTYAALNPQGIYGADLITRIDYTIKNEDGLTKLAKLVREEINKMIRYFCKKDPELSQRIYDLVAVGNTIMVHIFAGLEVKNIAVSPFIPVVTRGFELNPSEIGIKINPQGKIRILPMISGFVGADTTAAILACQMAEKDRISLLLDIGTNGEIAIGNGERILTCSAAAGPAFEGASIRHGMGGVDGAIDKVWIDEDLTYTTIGKKPPKGICGSAVVDLTSQMLKAGLLEASGRMKNPDELGDDIPPRLKERLKRVEGKPALLIAAQTEGAVEDIYFNQKDIREVQLAKAAIAAGIQVLLKEMGITAKEIDALYLAGGFGNYIDYNEAINIGLLPKELRGKVVPIGNGAGVGAKMTLLSQDYYSKAERIRAKTEYLELSTSMDFQDLFVKLLEFN